MADADPAEHATRKSAPPPTPDTVAPSRTGGWESARSATDSTSVPPKIGRFAVRKLLGEGAFARVYLGFDPQLEREVAIKVPKVEELTPDAQEAFLRENRLAAIIHHPNICPIYDVGTDNGRPYIVMPMVSGTLSDLLKRLSAPMSVRTALAITRKLTLGLAAAHAKGIVHRDLKPANVLYDEANREVLIADFGLARFVDRATEASNGVPKGTPAYMSPEQARGQAATIGPPSDVYALGVILYELLTGRVPFTGSVWEVMRDHCEKPPVPPSALRAELDPRLDRLCLKALAKQPADRYASAKDFATALADALRADETDATPPIPDEGKRPRKPREPRDDKPRRPRAEPVAGPPGKKVSPLLIAGLIGMCGVGLLILAGVSIAVFSYFSSRPSSTSAPYKSKTYDSYKPPATKGVGGKVNE